MIQPESVEAAARLRRYVKAMGEKFPRAWKGHDLARSMRGQGIPSWPDWYYCPMRIDLDMIEVDQGYTDTPEQIEDAARLSALGAWRVSQGIYQFDETVAESLWDTPLTGEIPADVLCRMPEWACYIVNPKCIKEQEDYRSIDGFLVFMNFDFHRNVPRFCVGIDHGVLDVVHIPLQGTLEESVQHLVTEDLRAAACIKVSDAAIYAKLLSPVLNLALYLCSSNAELGGTPRRPHAKRTKSGMRLFAADQPRFWETAYRLGAAIREAQERAPSKPQGASHASPRAHVRRAHWHAFWTGPKAKVGKQAVPERKLILHWLPPVPVNVDPEHPVIPTIRDVEVKA